MPGISLSSYLALHQYDCTQAIYLSWLCCAGVVSFKVELENKMVTVVGNVSPTDVLESICKVMKRAELLVACRLD